MIGLVIGFFVLVAIGGILAAIAIPNLLTAMERSKQKRTMADLRSVATALESYATDHNEYPKAESVAALKPILEPTYTKAVMTKDGWETDFRYECWPVDDTCSEYAFGSGGKDKTFEHSSLREYAKGTATLRFDCDIIFSNGNFVQYPDTTVAGGQR